MNSVEIKNGKDGEYVETLCKCGCGLIIRTKLQKYITHEHYGKALKDKNVRRKQLSNKTI